MADKNDTPIPWASLAVIATFVSSSFLVPRAFDLLRPAEKDRAQSLVAAPLEVDARLWEDPFGAARRHEEERSQRCQKAQAGGASAASIRECNADVLAARRSPAALRDRLDADDNGTIDEALVLTVLVPGNPFVGAEESRRRARYAVLAGLQADGYLPDEVEHIGLLNLEIPPPPRAASVEVNDRLLVPYELMSDRRLLMGRGVAASASARPQHRHRSVLVLWLDEAALPTPKLDALAYALQAIVGACEPACPKLALIGPSSSEGLRQAVQRLDELATRRQAAEAAPIRPEALAGYRLLARMQVFNNASTIEEADLIKPEEGGMQAYMRTRLARITGSKDVTLVFERTIATDDELIERLACELEQRIATRRNRRIVTITESDSIHARSMERRLRKTLRQQEPEPPDGRPVRESRPEDRLFFYRGIDGVTVREGAERNASLPNAKPKDGEAPNIEWPESRDQLDYLRRMAAELQRSEGLHVGENGRAEPIEAIGIFGNDVHDKLLILQALHETFPDKVFFTTDMDARYIHPRALPFTRNLIVASSLPLQFPIRRAAEPPPPQPAAAGVAVAGPMPAPAPPVPGSLQQLHAGTPPFRDVYQSATYVAARLAGCRALCTQLREQAQAALEAPSVYEIGRSRAIPLIGLDLTAGRALEPQAGYAVGVLTLVLLMGVGLLVWPATPALRAVREAAMSGTRVDAPRMTAGFVAMYGALLGATLGSAVEALSAGRLGLHGVVAWTLLGSLGLLCVHPGASLLARLLAPRRAAWAWLAAMLAVALLAGHGWSLLDAEQPFAGEPMAWAQGVSGWPSHFLNLLAVMAGLVSLDMVWSRLRRARARDDIWLALPEAPPPVAVAVAGGAASRRERLRALALWVQRHSLLFWSHDARDRCVDFEQLWPEFRRRGTTAARLVRVAFWYALTVLAIVVLFTTLSDHYVPEVPVRGREHRKIISDVLILALLLLPLVVVVVADATMLCWRLIRHLSRTRTLYPAATVRRFARELGADQLEAWCEPIAAEPAHRDDGPIPARAHSLLDDWIDMRIVARRTAVVAPLVLAPFVMLALMVLARSRLFDNWALTWPIALSIALYVLWLGLLAWLLKDVAEAARSRALASMNADLRWLAGAGPARAVLIAPMQKLIASVENERSGAFAPLFDQWFFKGLLVPLGGAGSLQLLDRLLAF